MMARKTVVIFWDGRWLRKDTSWVDVLAPGHFQARGVFETMRAERGKVQFLDDHLARLRRGLEVLRIPLPYSRRSIGAAVAETIRRNGLTRARVRIMVWRDTGRAHMAVIALPYHPFTRDTYRKGLRAVILRHPRSAGRRLADVKSLDYHDFLAAFEKARHDGADEAVLVNRSGHVFEGSRSNIFCVEGGALLTPPLSSGCLNGIIRRKVIALARLSGGTVREVPLRPSRILKAQEVFVTNSLLGIMPVTAIQGRRIANGHPGPLTVRIAQSYRKLTLLTT